MKEKPGHLDLFAKLRARLPVRVPVIERVLDAFLLLQEQRHARGLYYVDLSEEAMIRALARASGQPPEEVVDIVAAIMEVSAEAWPECVMQPRDNGHPPTPRGDEPCPRNRRKRA